MLSTVKTTPQKEYKRKRDHAPLDPADPPRPTKIQKYNIPDLETFQDDMFNIALAWISSRRVNGDSSDEIDFTFLFNPRSRKAYTEKEAETISQFLNTGKGYTELVRILTTQLRVPYEDVLCDIKDVHALIDLYAEFLETENRSVDDLCTEMMKLWS